MCVCLGGFCVCLHQVAPFSVDTLKSERAFARAHRAPLCMGPPANTGLSRLMLVDTDLLEGMRATAKPLRTGIHGNHTHTHTKTKQSMHFYLLCIYISSLAHTPGRFQDAEMHKYVVIIPQPHSQQRWAFFCLLFPLFSTYHLKIPPVTFLRQEFHITISSVVD